MTSFSRLRLAFRVLYSNLLTDAADSEDDKATENNPPVKQKHFYENRTLMLAVSVSALVVMLITLVCLIRKVRFVNFSRIDCFISLFIRETTPQLP